MNSKTKTSVWKNYFSMLRHAGLPWVLMVICFVLSLLVSILSLALANQISVVLQENVPIHSAVPEIWKLIGVIIGGIVCMA